MVIQNNKNRTQIQSSKTKPLSATPAFSRHWWQKGKVLHPGAAQPQHLKQAQPLRGGSVGVWWRREEYLSINRARVHFYWKWKGTRRPQPEAGAGFSAVLTHPPSHRSLLYSGFHGWRSWRWAGFVLFSEKASSLPSQHLYTKPCRGHSKTHTQCSEEPDEIPGFYGKQVYPYPKWNYTNSYIW